MLNLSKPRGFTLIEILLVTVILASFVLAWVRFSHTESTDSLLKKTSEQMQLIVQAGRSYFLAEEYYWPKEFDELENKDYLPSVARCSSWQSVTHTPDPHCENHQPFHLFYGNSDYIHAKSFGVSLTLPDETLATRLAALLPLSNRDNNTVTAITTFPAAASDIVGKIISAGTVRNNQNWPKSTDTATGDAENGYVKKPNCPSPLVPAIYFTPYNFTLSFSGMFSAAAGDDLGIDTWCESNDPNDLSAEQSSCCGYNCPAGASTDHAYSGPQHCDYASDLDPHYWRLNFYSCQNSGTGKKTAGKEGSLIYFTVCLKKEDLAYPGYPYFNQMDINKKIQDSGYKKNEAGCYYATSCTFKNSPSFDTFVEDSGTCQYKRRRCNKPIVYESTGS
jgi:prepilin-type N-terminal cleavage/methylation domain-containing protein